MKQSNTGSIAFFDYTGDKLYERKYDTLSQRVEHIDFFKRIYGKRSRFMYYIINPIIDSRQLRKVNLDMRQAA